MTLPFHVPSTDRGANPWRVLAGGELTGGRVTFGDAVIPPRSPGPARHVHTHEDEAIYVVTGTLTIEVGSERFEAGPQSLTWLPRGVPHIFANLTDQAVSTVGVITPSGLEGMFREHAEYLGSLSGPPDEAVLLEISIKYGVLPADGGPLT